MSNNLTNKEVCQILNIGKNLISRGFNKVEVGVLIHKALSSNNTVIAESMFLYSFLYDNIKEMHGKSTLDSRAMLDARHILKLIANEGG